MLLDYLMLRDGVGGLTIDNYNGHLLIQWYSKGIYKFRYIIIEAIKKYLNLNLF